jgi:hypothetical protein
MNSATAGQRIEAIVGALEVDGVGAAPIQEATNLAVASPEAVFDLARAVIRRFPEGGTFLDAVLSYLLESLWDGLVSFALDALADSNDNDAACSIIAYARLQNPSSLHPHLDRIFNQRPNERAYYENYPWMALGDGHFEFLRGVIEGPDQEPGRKLKAWRAMLQTRHPDWLVYALMHDEPVLAPNPWTSISDTIKAYFHLLGQHREERGIRRLCPDSLHHLVFQERYFEGQSRPPWLARVHPTWRLEPSHGLAPMRFGGQAQGNCSVCGGRLHRFQRFTLEWLTDEEKRDWLAALPEPFAPAIRLAGRVPVPFFRSLHECDPL